MSNRVPPRDARFLFWLGATAVVGLGLIAFTLWRGVTVEEIQPEGALQRFSDIRSRLPVTGPMLHVDEKGVVTRRPQGDGKVRRATRLHVLAYVALVGRLAGADAPFWFLKMKGPAFQYAFRGTGFDLHRLGVTPAELEEYGVCLVLDETRPNGDRLLVWTE